MSHGPGLWDWAVAAYARPGVEPCLLDLQDRGGHCVPYLLWVAWMAQGGRAASDVILRDGATLAREWDAAVVAPLRQARRSLRGGDHQALHTQVKAAELEAERAIMTRLEAQTAPPGAVADLIEALREGAEAWSPGAAPGDMVTLARLLS